MLKLIPIFTRISANFSNVIYTTVLIGGKYYWYNTDANIYIWIPKIFYEGHLAGHDLLKKYIFNSFKKNYQTYSCPSVTKDKTFKFIILLFF